MTLPHLTRCFILAVAVYVAAATVGAQNNRIAITDVNVIDVATGQIFPNRTVIVTGKTITAITQAAPPGPSATLNGTGKFLIPGLWDMHAHIQGNEKAWL